jgi:hypothetical protein
MKKPLGQSEIRNAIIIPISGARIMKLAIWMTGPEFTESKLPECAIAAPANPPINVCDEEDGMPRHQVKRFQMIAAIKPEKITSRVIDSDFTVLAIVLATP